MNIDYDIKRHHRSRWDRCVYRNTHVLKNKFKVRDKVLLQEIEANYTMLRLRQLAIDSPEGGFDYTHFTAIHKHIFQDLYEWAGKPRKIDVCKYEDVLGGRSIEYAPCRQAAAMTAKALLDMTSVDWHALSHEEQATQMAYHMAVIWKIHLFRDGNTRTLSHFTLQYANHIGLHMDYLVLAKRRKEYRDALALACADHTYLADKLDRNPLVAIVYEAMESGRKNLHAEPEPEPAAPEPEPESAEREPEPDN